MTPARLLLTAQTLAERIAFHTGQPVERIERDSDRHRRSNTEEAKAYSLIDHVVHGADQVVGGAGSRQ